MQDVEQGFERGLRGRVYMYDIYDRLGGDQTFATMYSGVSRDIRVCDSFSLSANTRAQAASTLPQHAYRIVLTTFKRQMLNGSSTLS